jgi:DNA-binding response OmpR family regulator
LPNLLEPQRAIFSCDETKSRTDWTFVDETGKMETLRLRALRQSPSLHFSKGWLMKRRILLVDDEVAVLLTLKAVLEISGFDVDTAASAREGKLRLRKNEYAMVITDMRMESEAAGVEVIKAARSATYQPAVALLTAFPTNDEGWQYTGADKMLIKPMQTRILLQQIEKLLVTHEAKKAKASGAPAAEAVVAAPAIASAGPARKTTAKKTATKKSTSKKATKKQSK